MKISLCGLCKHRVDNHTCAAYDRIPDKFRFGHAFHLQQEEGDRGIQFEVADNLPEDLRSFALEIVAGRQAKPETEKPAEAAV